jgi:hypothetical protein
LLIIFGEILWRAEARIYQHYIRYHSSDAFASPLPPVGWSPGQLRYCSAP